jgi:hypothetical protein
MDYKAGEADIEFLTDLAEYAYDSPIALSAMSGIEDTTYIYNANNESNSSYVTRALDFDPQDIRGATIPRSLFDKSNPYVTVREDSTAPEYWVHEYEHAGIRSLPQSKIDAIESFQGPRPEELFVRVGDYIRAVDNNNIDFANYIKDQIEGHFGRGSLPSLIKQYKDISD